MWRFDFVSITSTKELSLDLPHRRSISRPRMERSAPAVTSLLQTFHPRIENEHGPLNPLSASGRIGVGVPLDVVREPRSVQSRCDKRLALRKNRLALAEKIFFTWLVRVMVAAVLVGSAWIDDAPPLGIWQ